jgi:hypothetical protein
MDKAEQQAVVGWLCAAHVRELVFGLLLDLREILRVHVAVVAHLDLALDVAVDLGGIERLVLRVLNFVVAVVELGVEAAVWVEAPLEDRVVCPAGGQHALLLVVEAHGRHVRRVPAVVAITCALLQRGKLVQLDLAKVVSSDHGASVDVGGIDVVGVLVLAPDAGGLVAEHARPRGPLDLLRCVELLALAGGNGEKHALSGARVHLHALRVLAKVQMRDERRRLR